MREKNTVFFSILFGITQDVHSLHLNLHPPVHTHIYDVILRAHPHVCYLVFALKFILPKRLLLACICIEKILIAKSSNHQKISRRKMWIDKKLHCITNLSDCNKCFSLLVDVVVSYIQNFFQINQKNNEFGSTLQKFEATIAGATLCFGQFDSSYVKQ